MKFLDRGARAAFVVALTASVALVLASCGDDSSSSSGSESGSGDKSLSLTVAVPFATPTFTSFYWAQSQGLFKEHDLDVTLEYQAASVPTNIASGRLTLGAFGTSGAFPAAVNGRQTSIVYPASMGVGTSAVIVKAGSYSKLEDLSGKKVGIVGAASSSFGAATGYSNYIVDHGGKALDIQIFTDPTLQVGALKSGQIAAAVGLPDIYAASIASGEDELLVDPTGDLAKSVVGADVVSVAWFGLQDQIEKNSDAIGRFVAAMKEADQQLATASNDEIVAALMTFDDFKKLGEDTVTSQVESAQQFFAKDDGEITEDVWNESLKSYGLWGLDVDLDNPALSYDSIVDMSFWDDAE